MNSRKCEICNNNVHRASYVKHLGSKKHLENEKLNGMIIPVWLFQEHNENKNKKNYNPKPLKLARDKIKLDDKQLNKELAEKMINPCYFTDRKMEVGFEIKLDTHHINHANSKLFFTANYPEFGVEVRYINKIRNELSVFFAGLINQ